MSNKPKSRAPAVPSTKKSTAPRRTKAAPAPRKPTTPVRARVAAPSATAQRAPAPAPAPKPDSAALAHEWGKLDAGVPLALLPVRLETRFIGGELLIRIEPDVLHHDMHVGVLRADEKALADQFWADVAAAGANASRSAAAWRTLAGALGPWRAAWVARAVKLGMPEGAERGKPALARLLPARWVAKAWFAGKAQVLGWSQRVRAPLHLGFDIDDPHWVDDKALAADEQAGRLRLDPQARWMTDFDEAEACGMAIRVPLAAHPELKTHLDAGKAVDELVVVGVDHETNATSAGNRLTALFDAHRYSRGLELVCQGVPTNNTEQVRTGVSPSKPDLDGLMRRELRPWLPGGTPPAAVAPQTQGGRLARALGLDRAALVQRLEDAGVRQDEASAMMNRLIWPLSFGELFDKLLAGVTDPARNRLVDRSALGPLKEWFCAHVRGGGNLATLRVGAQPFGVLPVRRLRGRGAGPTQGALPNHVNDAVDLLRDTWREVLPRVATLKPAGADEDAQATLLKILSSQPHPWEFTVQRASDCRELLGQEYAGYNWAAAQHVPMLGALMPNMRFGEPGQNSLEFIHLLFGADKMPVANTADAFLGRLVCWSKLLRMNTTKDALPDIVAAPANRIAALQSCLEGAWIADWNQDALRWQDALKGRPLPPIPKTLQDLIAYIDWLLGNPNWLVEILKPEGVWAAYHTGIIKRKVELERQGVKPGSTGPGAELKFCQDMIARIGDDQSPGIPTLLREARAALVMHGERLAPLMPLYARWARRDRLLTHLRQDGPTGAYLAYEDEDIGRWPTQAQLVQASDAADGDLASSYLAELGNAAAAAPAARWDAARVTNFAEAARSAAKPAALGAFRAAGMSAQRVPPLLFQLARAALAATEGAEQEAVRKQLQALAAFPPEELQLRLRETLGLATHRLDAWATGLASEALFALREKRPEGLQIGAYGWVENLRRDEQMRQSEGHLLAPSLAHAATAAVLRAGWQAFGTGPKPEPGLAVDLSSARARAGRWLLEGLHSGQSLGDLLGYRLERALHDHQLDLWIDKVRRRVSAVTGVGNERQPVDGLSLWNQWNTDDAELKAMVEAEPRLRAEFAGLGQQLDALLDLTSAESVYQLVQGNMTRMAASLDALGLPDVDPPPCTFPNTPRPGRTMTHRLLITLPEGTAIGAAEGWADSPRAVAAPALERWARLALGPATRYRIVTRWVDGAGTASAPNAPVDAGRLGLSALDTVYLVDDADDGGTGLRARLMGIVSMPSAGQRPWRLEVLPDARDGLAGTELTAAALLGLARRVRRMLSDATPADARHFGRPGDDAAPGTDADIAEFAARAKAVAQRLTESARRLDELIPKPPAATAVAGDDAAFDALLEHALAVGVDAPSLRGALLDATRFGESAHPLCGLSRPGEAAYANDIRQLMRLAVAASRGLAGRTARVAKALESLGAGNASQRSAAAHAVFDAALGRELPVTAGFRLSSTDGAAAEVEASLAVSGKRPGEEPGAHMHWLAQVAKVQPRAARLADALLLRAGTGAGAVLELHTAQLPHVLVAGAPEAWAATAAPQGDRQPRVCITACGARPLPLAGGQPAAMQALLLDQWSEIIPDGRQTAAVAFHFDAPASRPPQAILLAVVPDGQAAWTCGDVVDTVRETLEWSRLRAVGPAELAEAQLKLGQYLPALYSSVPFELPDTLLAGKSGLLHRWRLEGKTTTEELEPGIQARIGDPYWMLSRQWQVGEFQGEDAATPVVAQVELETAPLTSLRCEPGGKLDAKPLVLPVPEAAEALTEAQDPGASAGGFAWRATAGLRFLSMLRDAGLSSLGERVYAAFKLASATVNAELVPPERRRVDEISALAPDGAALAKALRADPTLAGTVTATPAERTQLAALASIWLAQYESTVASPVGGNGWASARMEYGVSLAAASADGELVLRAEEYPGGRLDWDAFDLTSRGLHGLTKTPAKVRMHVRIPSPLRYAGMPADRWWEFEDREVHFGGLQATPADLQRMMLSGFAACYNDDWFSLPITLPSGQLARVKSMHVVDSLGRRHPIAAMATLDHAADARRPWRMFELSGDPGPAAGRAPWLLLAPALPDAIEGPPVEQVHFVRDETSNVAWALERQVEGPLGEAIDRVLAWKTSRSNARAAPPIEGRWRYEVAPPTPGFMVPLLPERNADAQVRLRRGRVHQGVDPAGRPVFSGATGRILNPGAPGTPLRLFEEEIPADGVEVQRAWQLARDRTGRVWLWLGQRKRPGRPAKEPGVVFDRTSRR